MTQPKDKLCKVQFIKPVTITGRVTFHKEINKYEIRTKDKTSWIDASQVTLVEEIKEERYTSEVK